MKSEINKDKKFWIHPDDFNKIIQYASSAYNQFESEIGGQMIVVEDEEGDYILKKPVILKQEISAGNCTMEASALTLHYAQMMQEHGKNVRHCWWHSHHTMQAFWSGTDNATILETPAKDWTVSLVVNLKREYKLRIQFFSPFLHEENVELNFLTVDNEANESIDKEVRELCSKEKARTYSYGTPRIQRAKSYPTVGTNQMSMLREDVQDMNDYNYGFYGYNHTIDGTPIEKADFSKVSYQQMTKFEEKVDDLTDEASSPDNLDKDGLSNLRIWNKGKKKLDKSLAPFNLRLKTFKSAVEFDQAILGFWVDEYFENINKPERMVNQ